MPPPLEHQLDNFLNAICHRIEARLAQGQHDALATAHTRLDLLLTTIDDDRFSPKRLDT